MSLKSASTIAICFVQNNWRWHSSYISEFVITKGVWPYASELNTLNASELFHSVNLIRLYTHTLVDVYDIIFNSLVFGSR